MITLDQLNIIFAEKLLATNSLDAALKKVTWVAYKQGYADAEENKPLQQEPAE